ncbi:hypothetical protein [uncultured Methanobrevibacter sp.]|uniref:hypothetical protein n=1 Tax=uncultured Methanobrevibacter sp. TaxID=253161 RepID=UPI00262D6B47|nr:hypothetical protein [uncultured Methanobrevibacter sp.]
MDPLTDECFLKFLKSFEKKSFVDEEGHTHQFYDSLTELSRSDSPPYDSLINDSQKMYGLDWMVKASSKWRDLSKQCQRNSKRCKHRFPKSVDALFCKKSQTGNLELHIIEFKFIPDESNKIKLENLFEEIIEKSNKYSIKKSKNPDSKEKRCFSDDFVENFKVVRKYYFDKLENSLQLKPYEAIFIALPGLYEDYCKEKNYVKKDIRKYLSEMEKYYWVCISSGTQNEDNLHKQAQYYEKYYKRMEPEIFIEARARTKKEFEDNLINDILV